MAPNKKKKKPASNPARGFSTTSIVSKNKIEDKVAVEEPITAETTISGPVQPASPAFKYGLCSEKQLHELSPDQLEKQLEESELQLLVEKHAEKSKKDSSRYVSKLQTERRLLRLHALPLDTWRWLPEETLKHIVEFSDQDNPYKQPSDEIANKKGFSGATSDELSIRLWTLRRTLVELGFLQGRIDEAIAYLLQNQKAIQHANEVAGRDGVWGVDDCLDWLALKCTGEEVPDYETNQTEAIQKGMEKLIVTPDPDSKPASSGLVSPNESETAETRLAQEQNAAEPEVISDTDTHSDAELEPHELLSRYVSLKTRVYERRPDLGYPESQKPKASKAKSKGAPQLDNSLDPKTRGLLRRLRKFRSDILFDLEEAEERWTETWVELVKETARRKRLGLDVDSIQVKQPAKPTTNPTAFTPDSTATPASEASNDADIDLGDLFVGLPDLGTDAENGKSVLSTSNADGTRVTIRDYGTWSGVGPRRVLEEACKARDSSFKISYNLISSSSFSNRHSLTIRWSRSQDIPVNVPLSGVSVEAGDRKFSCYMTEISSPNPTQSEAYISTVALFVIFGGSPKEAKSHLRLPATWKDLWDELAKERKEHLAKDDREELRQIRELVEKAETESKRVDTPLVYNTQQEITDKSRTTPKPGAHDNVQNLNPQSLIDLWSSKATSHAYIAMSKSRRTLPIFEFKTELLTAIESHQVVIICGETGCGKSTQVPAYILENELSNGRQCKIYCTEPRRISAISLARRVSEELGERKSDVGTLNSLVGYAIRLESHITPQTKLVYATTGIVMRMLEGGNDLQEITHLVLDEVHERTIDSDFLLIVLRKLMLRRPELRVVLMSATVNAEQFSNYLNGAPVLNVPGRTFPVQTKYLEDAIEITGYGKNSGSNMNSNENEDEDDLEKTQDSSKGDLTGYSPQTVSTLAEFDEYRIDYELVLRLLERIAKNALYAAYSKAVLVFLPGLAEIRRMNDILAGHPVFVHDWYIYPLHSTIATEEQEKAFLVPPPGIRKVVLATNIAETGITIPDVTCVIDTGKHREMRFDERRQLSRLIECFISRANAKQRRGRAGRVQNGLCFHLFTKARHDTSMAEQQTPEMLRLSLQDLVLRVKICKLGGIEQTLSEALDPPLAKNVRRAIDSLIDVKALTVGEDMTALGRQLAKLPLDVFLGKLILLGSLFSCLDATLTIAAILSSKTPFSAPMGARAQADLARLAYKKGDSDLLTVYNAYCAWKRVCKNRSSSEYQFCRKNFLSPQILSSIEDLKVQLTTTLVDSGFLSLEENEKLALSRARFYSRQRNFVDLPSTYNINTANYLVVNSVIAWSFYPKLLVRDNKGWRNVANNQTVSLFPTSVNKGVRDPPIWLSFYHIMQGSNKLYNAHETSAAEDFAIALVCGEADFRMYAGVIVIDGNRIRFKVNDWKIMIVLKRLRERIRGIISHFYRNPGKALSKEQRIWFEIWQKIFSREELLKTLYVHKG